MKAKESNMCYVPRLVLVESLNSVEGQLQKMKDSLMVCLQLTQKEAGASERRVEREEFSDGGLREAANAKISGGGAKEGGEKR